MNFDIKEKLKSVLSTFKIIGLAVLVIFIAILSFMFFSDNNSDKIGNASTKFNLLGKNDRIEIEAFDDPDVSGISCYLSYAKKRGIE